MGIPNELPGGRLRTTGGYLHPCTLANHLHIRQIPQRVVADAATLWCLAYLAYCHAPLSDVLFQGISSQSDTVGAVMTKDISPDALELLHSSCQITLLPQRMSLRCLPPMWHPTTAGWLGTVDTAGDLDVQVHSRTGHVCTN